MGGPRKRQGQERTPRRGSAVFQATEKKRKNVLRVKKKVLAVWWHTPGRKSIEMK